MLRTIIWYIHFAVSLLLTTPKIFIAEKLEKSASHEEFTDYVFKVTSSWADKQIKYSGAKFSVHGMENIPADTSVLFVSNHQSNFDIPVFLCKIPMYKSFIAKVELEKFPVVNIWMRFLSCVFMNRNDLRQSAECIIKGINILKSGTPVVVFPEGTRSKSGALGEFKPGAFKLATKAKVPIVPVTINGTYKILEQNNYKIKPAEVDIYIHPPIGTENLSREDAARLPDIVKNIIRKNLDL